MATRSILIGVGLASLAAIGGVAAKNFQSNRRLMAEQAKLEQRLRRSRELAAQNQKMTADLAALGDRKKLRRDAEQANQLQQSIDGVRLLLHNLAAATPHAGETKSEPVWAAGAEVMESKDWTYAGNKTPRDLLESFLWAGANGDVAKLAGLIGFQPGVKAQAQALFDQLPDTAKTEYATPEGIVATMIAASMPTDLQAASIETPGVGKFAVMMVREERADTSQTDLMLRADNSPDGWKLDVPAKVIAGFQAKLTGPK